MLSLSRTHLFLALALLTAIPLSAPAQAPKGNPSKRVTFNSFDGVKLSGSFFAPTGASKKDTTVLLLHDFDTKAGGNSHADGWDALAEKFADAGYSVLSFDFRGFGDSKTVDETVFWKHANNSTYVTLHKATPSNIDYKDFKRDYYRYLANDIAAAKAYLDVQNGAGVVNSSNIVVIGAGQGATLGSMWIASECRRCRDKAPNPLLTPVPLGFEEPESKDIVCAVWLTISPNLAGVPANGNVQTWNKIAVVEKKIPVRFLYGKNDADGARIADGCVSVIKNKAKDPPVEARGIEDTNVKGSKLLRGGVLNLIVKGADFAGEARGARASAKRDLRDSRYYFVIPGGRPRIAKPVGEEASFVDVNLFFPR
jgi:Alpha/beta hydrolase family